jgi:hypothetical protein
VETACCRVGWSIVDPLSDRANGRENPVGCQHGKENEKGVKIIPAQIYAGVDTLSAVCESHRDRVPFRCRLHTPPVCAAKRSTRGAWP